MKLYLEDNADVCILDFVYIKSVKKVRKKCRISLNQSLVIGWKEESAYAISELLAFCCKVHYIKVCSENKY